MQQHTVPAKATFLVDTTYHFGVSLFFCTFLALLTDDVCDNDDDDDDGDDNDDDDLIASGTHTASCSRSFNSMARIQMPPHRAHLPHLG